MAKRRGGLTVIAVENLKARADRYEVPDPGCSGLYLQVHPSGAKSWAFRYRFAGKSRKLTIGTAYTDKGVEVIKIGDARDIADEARVMVARRIDPIEVDRQNRKEAEAAAMASRNTLKAVATEYLGVCSGLRSAEHRKKVFERLIYPKFATRQVESIKRSEIADLVKEVAKSRGPVMADRVLATLRGLLNWYAVNSDDYVNPIVPRMALTSTKERARSRVLSDIEIKAAWIASEQAGIFGAYVRFTLLTATRRCESAYLRRSEIEGPDWTIPAHRYKTKIDHTIPLSAAAVAVISKTPKIGKGDFVFTTDGRKPISGFGPRKVAFDALMLAELRKLGNDDVKLPRWTLHDLRRSARTLLSRAGVPSDHAEACLGHVKGGVEGTYDRHSYHSEKREAFEKLANLIDAITKPALIAEAA